MNSGLPKDRCVYENYFLISQPKHLLWILQKNVSMRGFFRAPKTHVKTDGQENNHTFTLTFFAYLALCKDIAHKLRLLPCHSWHMALYQWRKTPQGISEGDLVMVAQSLLFLTLSQLAHGTLSVEEDSTRNFRRGSGDGSTEPSFNVDTQLKKYMFNAVP